MSTNKVISELEAEQMEKEIPSLAPVIPWLCR